MRLVVIGLLVVALGPACQRGPSKSALEEMDRRARIKEFFRDYPDWSGPVTPDRSAPHLAAPTAEALFDEAGTQTRPIGSTPGLLVCRMDVHPTGPVRDAIGKIDYQLSLTVDRIPRRWCCAREPAFFVTYANFSVDKGASLDFYVSDKDLRHDDRIGDHELVFEGTFPVKVQDPDFHAECRWLPNSELGPAITVARENAAVAMDKLGTQGRPRAREARASLQHLAALVGWSDAQLKGWAAAYDTATAEPTAERNTAK